MAKQKNNSNTPETLEEALVVIGKLEKEKSEALDLISDLKSQLSKANKSVEEKDCIVEFKGAKYKVTAKKFHYNGNVRTADELLEDNKLVGELVEIGAGFLEKIEE